MAIPFEELTTVFSFDDFVFRIGELSKMTGVSPRQLRYWEQRGYIKSLDRTDDKRARSYNYAAYVSVKIIKHYLDDGYTLEGAVSQMRSAIKYLTAVRQFIRHSVTSVDFEDGGAVIDLGVFDGGQQKHLYAHTRGTDINYEIRWEQKRLSDLIR